jgi:NADH-quinone oxidoreductase subunit L
MEILVVFLPLLAFLIAGTLALVPAPHEAAAHGAHHADADWRDRTAQLVTCGAVLVAMVLSWMIFARALEHADTRVIDLLTWIDSVGLKVMWSLRIDALTAVMLVVVNTVSAMVHVYSIGYMSHDPQKPRFMAYLSLFTFFMLMLVTADNLVQLFFGWEGVGLASYLLINFWYDKPSANNAGIKAFLVNRVGDFGFVLGICGVFALAGSVDFQTIFSKAPEMARTDMTFLSMNVNALTCVCLLLFVGAMGKSAQLGLHTWLPDAMEGPTPVSALIHAATMVTAGVFMVCRLSPLFEHAPGALAVVALVGAATAFVAATIGLTQFDIKRVIAYSTMSQLGYMFFAAGVSAYGAAMFHLFTHAFFKALLFLGAGSVIHALSGEQDMRKMGGVWRLIPITYVLMWIGSLALAGMPIFAGYYSKDIILEAAFASGSVTGFIAFWLGIAAALMTAFYSWRLLFLTFHGKPRADHHAMEHVHESPWVMLVPLFVLAAGAVLAGILFEPYFTGHERGHFWGAAIAVLEGHDSVEAAHHGSAWVGLLPTLVGLIGIALAVAFYVLRTELPGRVAARFGGLYRFLFNKWYFDEAYDAIFVRPARALGVFLWKRGDGTVIDGFGPDGIAAATRDTAIRASRLQSGYVYHYAFAMVIGVVAFVVWFSVIG